MKGALDPDLEITLKRAEGLIRSAGALTLALEDLGAIELPPVVGADVDQAQLRAIATLYLAAELEGAGVIPAVDSLTRLLRTGSLPLNLGGAAPLIEAFWQSRNERASTEERLGFFAGLFGTTGGPDDAGHPRNTEFEDRMIDLCEALYRLDEQASNATWGGVAQQARAHGAAERLLANLLRRSGGITVFLAQEILAAVRQSLAILGHAAVRAAFGARTLWDVVGGIDRRLRQPRRDPLVRLRRGQAGMTVLAWLAEAAPMLSAGNKPIVGLDHPVIAAAVDWLEASLTLTEAETGTTQAPAAAASPWTALAG
jgi:hypothetical protein